MGGFFKKIFLLVRAVEALEEELLSDIMTIIQAHTSSEHTETGFSFLQDIFTVLEKNKDICSALLSPNGDISFVHQIEQLISNQYSSVFHSNIDQKSIHLEYFHSFCLSGCIGLIKQWLSNDTKESPEYMAKLTFHFIENTMKEFE